MEKFCIHCGQQLGTDASFCNRCGKPVGEEKCVPMQEDGISRDAMDVMTEKNGGSLQKCARRIPGKKWGLAMVAVVLVVSAFFGGLFPASADRWYVDCAKSAHLLPSKGYSVIWRKVVFADGTVKTIQADSPPQENVICTFTDGTKLYRLTDAFYTMKQIYPQQYSEMREIRDEFDTSGLTTMKEAFQDCKKLRGIQTLSRIDTSHVKDMRATFCGCEHLTNLSPLAQWDMSQVESTVQMFCDCKNLSDISPLAAWDVSRTKKTYNMFCRCARLEDISPLAHWDVSHVEGMVAMFIGCSKLADVSPLAHWNTSKVEEIDRMFEGCIGLTDVSPLAQWDVSNVKPGHWGGRVFYGCNQELDLSPLAGWTFLKRDVRKL